MAKNTTLENLAAAIGQELTIYHEEVIERVNYASQEAMKKLVKLTRATAPEGARRSYRRHITSKIKTKTKRGATHVWYVQPPDHRLTHLLVHGHATKDGGRTKANPFLKNALDTVLPEYEENVKEAIKK